ncbi:MAG: DUF5906 domain-containing protein [Vicinamibacterales bacterium]
MMTLQEFAGRFDAKANGRGYMAHCPVHEDSKASLSINQDGDKILVNCFAGCDTKAVLQAGGLTMKDLFISNGHKKVTSPIVATYDYRDQNGVIRYRKQRTANKKFFFERPVNNGGWTSRRQNGDKTVMEGIERLPYRLDELIGKTFCFICEGEKDCDRLWTLDLPATTNDGGASEDLRKPKWTDALTQQLKANGVDTAVCIPDNDGPGRAHMKAVARSCTSAGIETRIVNLPGLPPKGDVSDWLDAGHTPGELIALCDATDVYVPPSIEEPEEQPADDESLSAAIKRLNRRFGIVTVGNKVVVMENSADGGIEAFWPFEEFNRLLIKDRIKIATGTGTDTTTTTKEVGLAKLWLCHADGRSYERLVFAMPGSAERHSPKDYNGWLGFRVKPEPGEWSKNRQHLLKIICASNPILFTWLFNWMAALVQWPGRHAFTAVVLRGGQGIGKGHFAHLMLGALFHAQQYLHIIGSGMLTLRFNEHLSGKVLIFADESTWGGDPAAADKLKGMVTESTIPIERKFLPLVEEPSALHIVIASNNEWPIAIAMDDRRFVVFDVAETERQNDSYFAPLREELESGGLAAMLHDLLAQPIDEHALRHPPSTKGKREVMAQSLKPIERWWYEKLLKGSLSFNKVDAGGNVTYVEGWPESVEKASLHEDYLAFLDKHRDVRSRRSTETELGVFLKKFTPMQTQRRLPGSGASGPQYFWNLPSKEACREFWAKVCGWPDEFDWDEGG